VGACPPHVLWLEAPDPRGWGPKHAVLHDAPGCTGCAKCWVVCPFDAIAMLRPPGP
jgi:Fe-S-cluster-containing hydrogenase component 2